MIICQVRLRYVEKLISMPVFADIMPASDLCCLEKSNIQTILFLCQTFPATIDFALCISVAVSRNHPRAYVAFRKEPS